MAAHKASPSKTPQTPVAGSATVTATIPITASTDEAGAAGAGPVASSFPLLIPGSNLPWWVGAISTFGVPAAIAMYLVYALTTGQSNALQTVATRLDEQNVKTAAIADTVRTRLEEQNAKTVAVAEAVRNDLMMSNVRIEGYLRIMCVNSAKTQPERNTCLTVR